MKMKIEYFINTMLEKLNQIETKLYTASDTYRKQIGHVDKKKENKI